MPVTEFKGTRRDDRSLLRCLECECATFKIVKRGASEFPIIECANCEDQITGVKIVNV